MGISRYIMEIGCGKDGARKLPVPALIARQVEHILLETSAS